MYASAENRTRPPASDRPLRVLFVGYDGRLKNGASLALSRLVRDLDALPGVEAMVAAPGPTELVDAARTYGIRAWKVPAPPWVVFSDRDDPKRGTRTRMTRLVRVGRAIRPMLLLFERAQPDVVVTITFVSPVPAIAARFAGIPHVWNVHELVTEQPYYWTVIPFRLVRRCIATWSALIVTPSDTAGAALIPPASPRRVRTVVTGIEIERAATPRPAPPDDRTLELLALGRFEERKGAHIALQGVARARALGARVRLQIVGDVALGNHAAALLLKQCLANGAVEVRAFTERPIDALDACDVLLAASPNEALPRVVFEAMARAMPVIAAGAGGVLDIFDEGEGGRYFTADDPDALARLLCSIDADRAQLAALSNAAMRNVEGRFEVDAVAREFAEVLSEAATMRVRGGGLLARALRSRVAHRAGQPIVSPP